MRRAGCEYSWPDRAAMIVSAAFAIVGVVYGAGAVRWAGVFFGVNCLVLIAGPWLRRRPAAERVVVDGREVRRYRGQRLLETVAWDAVDAISIVTTDAGPWASDVFWLLASQERAGGCAVSNAAEGLAELLAAMQRLPGFDNALVIQAMGATQPAMFVVWRCAAGAG